MKGYQSRLEREIARALGREDLTSTKVRFVSHQSEDDDGGTSKHLRFVSL